MSVFDDIQKIVFSTAAAVFGDEAIWIPSGSLIPQETLVLYNSPNDPVNIGNDKYQYRPYNYSIEFYIDQFIGLKLSVDSGHVEKVTVKGDKLIIKEVYTKHDGRTCIAYAELDD